MRADKPSSTNAAAWSFQPSNEYVGAHSKERGAFALLFFFAISMTGVPVVLAADTFSTPDRIHGVNMRLVPHQEFDSRTPIDAIIKINDSRLEEARRAGFNWVRVGVDIAPWIDNPSSEEQSRTLNLVIGALNSLKNRNLRGVIALFVPAQKIVCDDYARGGYWAGLNAILAVLPDSKDFGIETVNEPPTCPVSSTGHHWDAMQRILYKSVRSIKKRLVFVVAGNGWGAIDGLTQLDPSPYVKDENTLFSIHYYEPFLFTHQEAKFLRSDKINAYVKNLDWPFNDVNAGEALNLSMSAVASDGSIDAITRAKDRQTLVAMFGEYARQGNEMYVSDRIQVVSDWANLHGIRANRIILGEFGVFRQWLGLKRTNEPQDVGDPWPTAPRWLLRVKHEAEIHHFGWAVWELDGGFGVICGDNAGTGEICSEYRKVFSP